MRRLSLLLLLLALALLATGFTAGNLESAGNLYLISRRSFSDPIKLFLGPSGQRGLYGFVQERPDGSLFVGLESYQAPPAGRPVAEGYGALPGRLWFRETLIEADGTMVARSVVAERLYLQPPARTPGGALTYDAGDLGTYLTRAGGDLILYHDGREVARWGPQ